MSDTATEATLAPWELAEIERANASGLEPVLFVHGLWLLSSSWQPWRDLFEAKGYVTIAPGWPDDPPTVDDAKANHDAFANKMVQQVTDHTGSGFPGRGRMDETGTRIAFDGTIEIDGENADHSQEQRDTAKNGKQPAAGRHRPQGDAAVAMLPQRLQNHYRHIRVGRPNLLPQRPEHC